MASDKQKRKAARAAKPRKPGALIDERRINLDQTRARADPVIGINSIFDPAGGHQGNPSPCRRPKVPQPLQGQRLQRRSRKPPRLAAMDHETALTEMRTCTDWWKPEVLQSFLSSVGAGPAVPQPT